jgi:hypothetical protein
MPDHDDELVALAKCEQAMASAVILSGCEVSQRSMIMGTH